VRFERIWDLAILERLLPKDGNARQLFDELKQMLRNDEVIVEKVLLPYCF